MWIVSGNQVTPKADKLLIPVSPLSPLYRVEKPREALKVRWRQNNKNREIYRGSKEHTP